jgi:hypothetical protein
MADQETASGVAKIYGSAVADAFVERVVGTFVYADADAGMVAMSNPHEVHELNGPQYHMGFPAQALKR